MTLWHRIIDDPGIQNIHKYFVTAADFKCIIDIVQEFDSGNR